MQEETPLRPGFGMTQRAKALRRDGTVPERMLWNMLRAKQLGGLKFRRQVPIGQYVVDFYCPAELLVIELDGISHVGRSWEDAERTDYLVSQGLRVLRVTNDDLLEQPQAVAEMILHAVGRH